MSATTTPQSQRQASLIREMNRSLSASRQEAGNLMFENDTTNRAIPDVDLTNQDFTFPSEIALDNHELDTHNLEEHMDDTHDLKYRSRSNTVEKKISFQNLTPSYSRDFYDIDTINSPRMLLEDDLENDLSMSIEAGRGLRRSMSYHDSPSPQNFRTVPHNDLNKAGRSKLGFGESLRKAAQIRSASNAQKPTDAAPKNSAFKKGRVASYAETSAKLMAEYPESSFLTENASPQQAKPSRFVKGRTTSYNSPSKNLQYGTPARTAGLSRLGASTHGAGNSTKLSFLTPEIENMAESAGGEPHKSAFRSSKSKSRFSGGGNTTSYLPVSGIPVPDEEKKIMASLKVLKDSVATLRRENAVLRQTCNDWEVEFQKIVESQELGRDIDAESAIKDMKSERLEKKYHAAQENFQKAQEIISRSEDTIRQITNQRDTIFAESERLSQELEAAKKQKRSVDRENTKLKLSHDLLEDECHHLKDLLLQETQGTLRFDANTKAAVGSTNQPTSRSEDPDNLPITAQQWNMENNRLRKEIEHLNNEIKQIKDHWSNETKTWRKRESELRNHVGQYEDTLRQFQEGLTNVVDVATVNVRTQTQKPVPDSNNMQKLLDQFVQLHASRKQHRNEQRQAKIESLRRMDERSQEETIQWKAQKEELVKEINRRNAFSASFESNIKGIASRRDETTVIKRFEMPDLQDMFRQLEAQVEVRGSPEEAPRPTTSTSNANVDDHLGPDDLSPLDTQVIKNLRLQVERDYASRGLHEVVDDNLFNITPTENSNKENENGDEGVNSSDGVAGPITENIFTTTNGIPAPIQLSPPGYTNGSMSKPEELFSPEATVRPSQPPLQALDNVISDIESDIKQLRTDFATLDSRLQKCNPKESRRARKNLIDNMMVILSHMDVSSERVYQLQDARYGLVPPKETEPKFD